MRRFTPGMCSFGRAQYLHNCSDGIRRNQQFTATDPLGQPVSVNLATVGALSPTSLLTPAATTRFHKPPLEPHTAIIPRIVWN